ncbi:methyltransferase dimerization domain-containing protein, partial [Acinetobacter baumannii]
LNIFEPLRSGEQNAKFVAKQLELNETGTLRLLEGLAAMQLLVKNGDNFGLTDVARNYLLKDSRVYMGAYLRVAERSINPS